MINLYKNIGYTYKFLYIYYSIFDRFNLKYLVSGESPPYGSTRSLDLYQYQDVKELVNEGCQFIRKITDDVFTQAKSPFYILNFNES